MKKKIVYILLPLMVLLSACGGKEPVAETVVPQEEVAIATPKVESAVVEKKVEEFEEEKFEFEPANLGCVLPKGFKETEYPGEYLYKTYPKDVSSINQVISENTENPTTQTKEEYIEKIEKEYYDAYGEEVKINVTQYDKIMVDGRPGLWIMYNFEFKGEEYDILAITLYNGVETNYITYLEGPGADWMDEFIESAKSIAYVPVM